MKKAEMGIGTLIIFIALLLVAAVAAGVLIQTSGSLQSKALTTGEEAKSKISTSVNVIEVSATNGINGTIRYFNEIIKLAPGSEAFKLSQAILVMSTDRATATLSYAGTDANLTNSATGYYTLTPETVSGNNGVYGTLKNDYDQDSSTDNLVNGTNGLSLVLNLSSDGYVVLGNCSGDTFNKLLTTNDYVSDVSGSCSNGNITSVTITPKELGKGRYAVEYLVKGNNWKEGNLNYGDVIKLYYEAPENIGESETVRLRFLPRVGTQTLTKFITPEVMNTERIYLYP